MSPQGSHPIHQLVGQLGYAYRKYRSQTPPEDPVLGAIVQQLQGLQQRRLEVPPRPEVATFVRLLTSIARRPLGLERRSEESDKVGKGAKGKDEDLGDGGSGIKGLGKGKGKAAKSAACLKAAGEVSDASTQCAAAPLGCYACAEKEEELEICEAKVEHLRRRLHSANRTLASRRCPPGDGEPQCCFFLRGKCLFGRGCRFAHGATPTAWRTGVCTFGGRCKLGHPAPTGTRWTLTWGDHSVSNLIPAAGLPLSPLSGSLEVDAGLSVQYWSGDGLPEVGGERTVEEPKPEAHAFADTEADAAHPSSGAACSAASDDLSLRRAAREFLQRDAGMGYRKLFRALKSAGFVASLRDVQELHRGVKDEMETEALRERSWREVDVAWGAYEEEEDSVDGVELDFDEGFTTAEQALLASPGFVEAALQPRYSPSASLRAAARQMLERDFDLGYRRLFSELCAAGYETSLSEVQELWIELQERIEIDRCLQMGRALDDLASDGGDDGDTLLEEAGMYLGNPRHWEDL